MDEKNEEGRVEHHPRDNEIFGPSQTEKGHRQETLGCVHHWAKKSPSTKPDKSLAISRKVCFFLFFLTNNSPWLITN